MDLTTPAAINDTLDLFESLIEQIQEHVSRHGTAARPELTAPREARDDPWCSIPIYCRQMIKKKNGAEIESEWNTAHGLRAPRTLDWFFDVAEGDCARRRCMPKLVELLILLSDALAMEEAWEEAFTAHRQGDRVGAEGSRDAREG